MLNAHYLQRFTSLLKHGKRSSFNKYKNNIKDIVDEKLSLTRNDMEISNKASSVATLLNVCIFVLVGYSYIPGAIGCGEPMKRVCYYARWADGALPDPVDLCTHVIYSFASIENGVLSNVWSNPLLELKRKNKNIKIMVAVGGWEFGIKRMSIGFFEYTFRFFVKTK